MRERSYLAYLIIVFLILVNISGCGGGGKSNKASSGYSGSSGSSESPDSSEIIIPPVNPPDLTNIIENIGQPPFGKNQKTYARNIWDMQVFDGKIYIGYGNSNNSEPEANAGPIKITYFDPMASLFESKFTVDKEQIDIFKILDGKLYIPGHDSRDSWEYGNFYLLSSGNWIKKRTIPIGIHVYDLAYYKGKLYAAIGHDDSAEAMARGAVLVSEDMGNTAAKWKSALPAGVKFVTYDGYRAYKLFEFNGKLYAADRLTNRSSSPYNNLVEINGTTASVIKIDGSKMFPGSANNYYKLVRTETFNNKLLYITGTIEIDHQWNPEGFFVASDFNNARRITFPTASAVASDVLVRKDAVYVLTYVRKSATEYTNIVYQTTNLNTWHELFRFNTDTFARSFEELNGDFYFGLGCNQNNYSLTNSTGTILRIKKSRYQ